MYNRLSLAAKIMAPVLGLAVLILLVVVAAFWLQITVSHINRQAVDASAQAIEASEVRALSRAIQRDTVKLMITIDGWSPEERKKMEQSILSRSQQLLTRAERLAQMVDPLNTAMTHDFVRLQQTVINEIGAVKDLALSDASLSDHGAKAKELFKTHVEPAEKAASKLTDGFIETTEKSVRDLSGEADRVSSLARLILIGVSLSCLIVGVGTATISTYRGIIHPLNRLVSVMGRISTGDFAASIDGFERQDEIGDMTRNVAIFKDSGIERVRLEEDAAANRAAAEADRARTEALRRQSEAEQSLVIKTLAENLVKLAKGDLTTRIEAEFTGGYRQLKSDFNAMVEQLETAIQRVGVCMHAIQSGTHEISAASDDLSRRTEQQAAGLEETAAALDEVTATVRKSADGASHARQVVATADGDAEKSSVVVREAVQAMDAIATSAQQISQIIGVIDEIAFQTNLLALNAGVEAARAGDAGRGFAVVASEVRALAQRSAEAAKEIKSLISASSTQVDNGVKLVSETGKSLERIMSQVTEINQIVGEIATGAKEQATGLAEVNTAINQMDQVTQQNAAMVEQSTAACHSLSQQAEQLSALLGQFRFAQAKDNQVVQRASNRFATPGFSVQR